ncbi:site-specific DNA-methyltransferase [Micromonospora sp. C51]|uniref:DNA methyltransferase n=1 Tax=Micromonospora sp. C51 TaxID=2824879 RepID=UPI001B37EF4E|nr:DNA methyltransferase [Micromonospora sp. C51]MBQ1051627.1 site-specific DNA-methyltransferase [Micromonospora sp. C51]
MAHIDNLIDAVSDPALRSALQKEYRKIARSRQFGLVFDRHKPESLLLPKFTVRRGDKVRVMKEGTKDRTDVDATGVWVVVRAAEGMVKLRSKADPSKVLEVSRDQVVVTREFDDPIYPGLQSIGRIKRGDDDKAFHAVINAENYHALAALLYPYEGKVDAIYIDPPYNTGARDWKYNNDYVDRNDNYRHSKWLSFMERRLRLAKRLLTSDGVLVVTVDENEVHHLGLLLETMFPTARRQMVTICINPSGASGDGLSRVEEYAFFCFFGSSMPQPIDWNLMEDRAAGDAKAGKRGIRWEWLLRGGGAWYRASRPNLCYPIVLDQAGERIVGVGDPWEGDDESTRPRTIDGHPAAWPVRNDGRLGIWRVDGRKLLELTEKGYTWVSDHDPERGTWTLRYLLAGTIAAIERGELVIAGRGQRGQVEVVAPNRNVSVPKTVWKSARHTAGGAGGTQLVSALLGRRGGFTFPKSVYAVQDALEIAVGHKPNALVLDFFAGTGTTLHATCLLNRKDGGQRRTVLVTNNEVNGETASRLRAAGHCPGDEDWEAAGVFRSATMPRCTGAIMGRQADGSPVDGKYLDGRPVSEGFDENVEFFELTYEDPALVSLGRKFSSIAPLLWLKAGAAGERIDRVSPTGWSAPKSGTYGVLFDTNEWSDFVQAVNARHDTGNPLRHAFIVTDSTAEYQQIVAKLDPSLPTTRLYSDYLRTFEVNSSGADG